MKREKAKMITRIISSILAGASVLAMIIGAAARVSAAEPTDEFEVTANTKVWSGAGCYLASTGNKSIIWGTNSSVIDTDISNASIKDAVLNMKYMYILADFDGDDFDGYRIYSNDGGNFGEAGNELRVVPGLEDVEIVQFGVASKHGIALDTDGNVWVWGYNENAAIGVGEIDAYTEPVKVEVSDVKKVGTGNFYSMILNNNGEVYFSGRNYGLVCLERYSSETNLGQFNGFEYISSDRYTEDQRNYREIKDIDFGDTYAIMELDDGHYVVGNHNIYNYKSTNNGSIKESRIEAAGESKYYKVTDGGSGSEIAYCKTQGSAWYFSNTNKEYVIDTKVKLANAALSYNGILAVVKDTKGEYRLAYKGRFGNEVISGYDGKESRYFIALDNKKIIYDEVNKFEIANKDIVDNIIKIYKNESIKIEAKVYPTDLSDRIKIRVVEDKDSVVKVVNSDTILGVGNGIAEIEVYLDGMENDRAIKLFVSVSGEGGSTEELELNTSNNGTEYVKQGETSYIKIVATKGDIKNAVGFTYKVVSGSGIDITGIVRLGSDWCIVAKGWSLNSTEIIEVTETKSGYRFAVCIDCVEKFPDDYGHGSGSDSESSNTGDKRIATKVAYSFDKREYGIGERFVIEYPDVTPYNAYKAWEVKVDSGLTKYGDYYAAEKPGTYTITVTEKISKLSASYKVVVKEKDIGELKLPDEVEIIYGENNEISYELPSLDYIVSVAYAPTMIRYEIDDLSQIITIGVKSKSVIGTTQPLFIGVSDGADYYVEKVIKLKIVEKSESGLKIKENNGLDEVTGLVMTVGTTEQLELILSNASGADIKWTSSNRNIARVDSFGNVYAMRSGVCTITAEDRNKKGYEDSIKITVMTDTEKEKYFDKEPTKINLTNEKFEVGVGERLGIIYEIIHINGYDQIRFEAMTDNISVTSGGVVTGLKVGKGQVRIYSDSLTYDTLIDINVIYGENYWYDISAASDMYANQPIIVTLTKDIGNIELKDNEVFISSNLSGNDGLLKTKSYVKGNKIYVSITDGQVVEYDKDYYVFIDMLGLHVRLKFDWKQ